MLTTTVCAALTAAGLAVAFLTAFRRRFVAATRIAAFALLPIGLAMAGLVDLAGGIGRAVGRWAKDLVLDPVVWSGFAVLAFAVVLYAVARVAGARGGRASGKESRAAGEKPAAAALGSGRGTAGGARDQTAGGKKPSGASGGQDEDFSDIEAILKKHGI